MRKKIIIGSILTVFLMLMLPTVSAVEYKTVKDANEKYVEELMEDLKDIPAILGSSGILLDILIKIVKFVINSIVKGIGLLTNFIGFVVKLMFNLVKTGVGLILGVIGLVFKIIVFTLRIILPPYPLLQKIRGN